MNLRILNVTIGDVLFSGVSQENLREALELYLEEVSEGSGEAGGPSSRVVS